MIRSTVQPSDFSVVCNLIAGRTCENCRHGRDESGTLMCTIDRYDRLIDSCPDWMNREHDDPTP